MICSAGCWTGVRSCRCAKGCGIVTCKCCCLVSPRCHSQLQLLLSALLVHTPLGHCSHLTFSPFGRLWPFTGWPHCLQWAFNHCHSFCGHLGLLLLLLLLLLFLLRRGCNRCQRRYASIDVDNISFHITCFTFRYIYIRIFQCAIWINFTFWCIWFTFFILLTVPNPRIKDSILCCDCQALCFVL